MNGVEHEAELEVLGSCMASESAACEAVVALSPADFVRTSHQRIFAAITALVAEGADTGPVAVADKLGEKPVVLLDMVDRARPSAIRTACGIVWREAERRRLAAALVDAKGKLDAGADVTDAMQVLHTENASRVTAESIEQMRDRILPTLTSVRETVSLPEWGKRGRFGELWVVGARAGVGKSAFASQIAAEFAGRHLKCRVYSYEMRPEDWLERLIAHTTGIGLERIEDGLADYQVEAVSSALSGDWTRFLDVVDCSAMTLDKLIADLRNFRRRGGRIAIVDYLQLAVEQTYEEVTKASRLLKLAAMSTGLLIIALSQLRRPQTDDATKPPSASMLRQSGALEQDADTVMLLHLYEAEDSAIRESLRKHGYLLEFDSPDETPYKRLGHVEFAKVRRGIRERIPAWFDGDEMRWSRVERNLEGRPL